VRAGNAGSAVGREVRSGQAEEDAVSEFENLEKKAQAYVML
jgi:hypothetical protein